MAESTLAVMKVIGPYDVPESIIIFRSEIVDRFVPILTNPLFKKTMDEYSVELSGIVRSQFNWIQTQDAFYFCGFLKSFEIRDDKFIVLEPTFRLAKN